MPLDDDLASAVEEPGVHGIGAMLDRVVVAALRALAPFPGRLLGERFQRVDKGSGFVDNVHRAWGLLDRASPLSVPPAMPPSADYPFGTENQGRDLFAVTVAGTPLTLRIGLLAGFIGLFIGTVLAFFSAYYGGVVDTVIRGIVDIGLTVPSLLVLIIIAVAVKGNLSVDQMALIVASLAWLYSAEPPAVHACLARGCDGERDPRLDRARGPRARPDGSPDDWHDDLLGDLQLGAAARDVVVVPPADRDHRHPVHRAVQPLRGA